MAGKGGWKGEVPSLGSTECCQKDVSLSYTLPSTRGECFSVPTIMSLAALFTSLPRLPFRLGSILQLIAQLGLPSFRHLLRSKSALEIPTAHPVMHERLSFEASLDAPVRRDCNSSLEALIKCSKRQIWPRGQGVQPLVLPRLAVMLDPPPGDWPPIGWVVSSLSPCPGS